MSIALHQSMPESAYKLLSLTRPFHRWKMPPSSALRFVVCKYTPNVGELEFDGSNITLRVSQTRNGQLSSLLITVAHEMLHLRLLKMGLANWEQHDTKAWKRGVNLICSAHGWDSKCF